MTHTPPSDSTVAEPRYAIRAGDGQYYIEPGSWGPRRAAGLWSRPDDAALAARHAAREQPQLAGGLEVVAIAPRPAGRYVVDFEDLRLTVLGSRRVGIAVTPCALQEAGPDGATLWLELHDGPLAIALTREQAICLGDWLLSISDPTGVRR